MEKQSLPSPERRSFLTAVQGVVPLAAVAIGGAAAANGQPAAAAPRWEPARHDKDNWMDEMPAKHRLVLDTVDAHGFGEALAFAENYLNVNRTDYGLQNSDLSVLIVARHLSTPFGYSDQVWAKYGPTIATLAEFQDPKTKQAPKSNVYTTGDYGELLPNRGTTIGSVTKQGVRFAVCGVATRGIAGLIANAVGGDATAINGELTSGLISNARIVPAGIVAVSRAQERGYTFVRA